jgi:hypothetical protein
MAVRGEQFKPKPTRSPQCPLHQVPMSYNAENIRWECKVKTCKQISFPEVGAKRGQPIIGKGGLEVTRIHLGDGHHVFLRASDNNVMLDVTDFLEAVEQQNKNGQHVIRLTLTDIDPAGDMDTD